MRFQVWIRTAVVCVGPMLFAFCAPLGLCQTPDAELSPPSSALPSGGANSSNAQIMQELEQMRARIQQLEGQLKKQSGPAGAADDRRQQVTTAQPPANMPQEGAAQTVTQPPT